MNLSPICAKVYLKWIGNSTWHTGHPLDKRRFYRFVTAFLQYSRRKLVVEELKRDISERYAGKLDPEYLEKEAEYYSCLFSELVEFIKVTKR